MAPHDFHGVPRRYISVLFCTSLACRYPLICDKLTVSMFLFRDMTLYQIGQTYYNDVIMGTMASHIISLTIAYPPVHSGADQRKDQSSTSLAFGRGIHRSPVNSPHKWPITRKMFPFDVVIMIYMIFFMASLNHWIKHKETYSAYHCFMT